MEIFYSKFETELNLESFRLHVWLIDCNGWTWAPIDMTGCSYYVLIFLHNQQFGCLPGLFFRTGPHPFPFQKKRKYKCSKSEERGEGRRVPETTGNPLLSSDIETRTTGQKPAITWHCAIGLSYYNRNKTLQVQKIAQSTQHRQSAKPGMLSWLSHDTAAKCKVLRGHLVDVEASNF